MNGENSDEEVGADQEDAPDRDEPEEKAQDPLSGSAASYGDVAEILSNLNSYSVKELKQRMLHFGGDRVNLGDFFEKAELRVGLKALMLSKLSTGDLKAMANDELRRCNIRDDEGSPAACVTFADVINDCDRETITSILMKLES